MGKSACVQIKSLVETCIGSLAASPDVKLPLTLVTENRWDDPDAPAATGDGPVENAVAALRDNKSEAELSPLVRHLKADQVRWAIDGAETNARNQAALLTRTTRVIEQLGVSIAEQLQQTFAFHEQMDRYEDLIVSGEKLRKAMPADFTDALTKLQQSDAAALTAAEDLKNVFTGLEKTFTSRRYKLEADGNQQIAYLYELQVRLESQRRRPAPSSEHTILLRPAGRAGGRGDQLALAGGPAEERPLGTGRPGRPDGADVQPVRVPVGVITIGRRRL